MSNPNDGGPMKALLDRVDWQAIEGDVPDSPLPYLTHQGVFEFGGILVRVYQLSDGNRVIDSEDANELFGCVIVEALEPAPTSPLWGEQYNKDE